MDMEEGVFVISATEACPRAVLYEQASTDSLQLGVYYNGMQGRVLEANRDDTLYRVRVGDQEGYMERNVMNGVWANWFFYAW